MTVLPFAIVDVFADAPLAGNPLAVVDGADGLADDVLRRIAGEFNQSETTFVLPPRAPGAAFRLRSFTASGAEVTGAGHNALGAWWWLAERAIVRPGALRQELGDDVLDLAIGREAGRTVVAMAQKPAALGASVPAARLAGPLGLGAGRLLDAPAQVVSTGAAHLLVPAASSGAVAAARPDAAALQAALSELGAQGCYLFARAADGDDAIADARFFNPTVGLWEDPATGSAAGPLAWWLARDAAAGGVRVTIRQGAALGRPSRIDVRLAGDGSVTLLGSAVLAAEGRLHIHDQEVPA